jgi:hypothetical protein
MYEINLKKTTKQSLQILFFVQNYSVHINTKNQLIWFYTFCKIK